MNFLNQIVLKKLVHNKLEPVYPNLMKYSTLTCEKNMGLLLYRYIEFPSIYVEYFKDILRFSNEGTFYSSESREYLEGIFNLHDSTQPLFVNPRVCNKGS